jgi:GNAT superfamily N-acetyltransferase
VTVRPVQPRDDASFLLAVFASTRAPELAALAAMGLDGDAFVSSQFAAQRSHIQTNFPHADDYVIAVGDVPAGRLVVNRGAEELLIIELALLLPFRGAGVGTTLVERMVEEATVSGLPVRCHVLEGSEAQRFWEGNGFVTIGREGTHLSLERRPATTPP